MSYLKAHDEHGGYSASVVRVVSHLGEVEIEECNVCGYLRVFCMHVRNTWHDERGGSLRGQVTGLYHPETVQRGTALLCDLCGVDGT